MAIFSPEFGKSFNQPSLKQHSSNSLGGIPVYSNRIPEAGKETLDDLENDDEIVERSQRFLSSIGNDETTVEGLFEYMRDADYNLAKGAYRAFSELPNLTKEQKQDYAVLKKRFDNADTGSLKQYLNAAADIGLDIVSDPTAILAALLVPFTGGASAMSREALAQAAKVGLKRVGRSFVEEVPLAQHVVKNMPRSMSKINYRRASAQARIQRQKAVKDFHSARVKEYGLLGAGEGFAWSGIDEYLRQERDSVDGINLREGLNATEIAGAGLLGAGAGFVLGGGATKLVQKLQIRKNREDFLKYSDERLLDASDPIFKAHVQTDKVIANTIGKPTTRFMTQSKKSRTLKQLMKIFRYDTYKLKEDGDFLGQSYKERTDQLQGKYIVRFQDSLRLVNGTNRLNNNDEDILMSLMRTRKDEWDNKVPNATQGHKDAADAVRKITNEVLEDAKKAGIYRRELNRGPNTWFPRRWKWSVVQDRRDELAEIMVKSNAVSLPDETVLKFLPEDQKVVFQKLVDQSDLYEDLLENFEKINRGELKEKLKSFDAFIPDQINETSLLQVYDDIQRAKLTISGRHLPVTPEVRDAKFKVASEVIEDMLQKKNLINELDGEALGTLAPSSFSPRKLFMLDDADILDFIDNDFNGLLTDYFSSSARLISRKEKLGINKQEFKDRFIGDIGQEGSIRDEMHKAGGEFTRDDTEALIELYEYATGLTDPAKTEFGGPWRNNIADGIKVSQQLAHLPLATLSSVTEIAIPLTRVSTKEYVKGLGQTIKFVINKNNKDLAQILQKEHNLTADEAYREMHRSYLGLEQAVQQRIDGLAGEGVQNAQLKKIQEKFFKYNLLSGWTRTVQLASFTMGKDMITRNLKTLVSLEGKKLTRREYKQFEIASKELHELGVDVHRGKDWIKDGARFYSDRTDRVTGLKDWDEFYENNVMAGAARFANEVILDPSKASVIRPNVQNSKWGTIAFQFLGYPTAFNNTVLKNFYLGVKRDPVQGGAKTLGAMVGMTMVAGGTNWLRDPERFENQEVHEVLRDAVSRWGGMGAAEYIINTEKNLEYGSGPIGSIVKATTGPAIGDAINALQWRQGPAEVLATNIPLYSTLSMFPEAKQAVKGAGKAVDRSIGETIGYMKPLETPSFGSQMSQFGRDIRSDFFEGKLVQEKIERTGDNPSSRVDRLTGVPYEEQAGDILENRKKYWIGNLVRAGVTGVSKAFKNVNLSDNFLSNPTVHKLTKDYKHKDPSEQDIQEHIKSGTYLEPTKEELDLNKKTFIDDSIEQDDHYFVSVVADEDSPSDVFGGLRVTNAWGAEVEAVRANQANFQNETNHSIIMGKGSVSIKSPFNWDKEMPLHPHELLYDEYFLSKLNPEDKEKALSLLKEIEYDRTKLEELDVPESTDFSKILRVVEPEKRDELEMWNKLFLRNNNMKFQNLMRDLGYDSISYEGSVLPEPRIQSWVPSRTRKNIYAPDSLTADYKSDGSELTRELTRIEREVGDINLADRFGSGFQTRDEARAQREEFLNADPQDLRWVEGELVDLGKYSANKDKTSPTWEKEAEAEMLEARTGGKRTRGKTLEELQEERILAGGEKSKKSEEEILEEIRSERQTLYSDLDKLGYQMRGYNITDVTKFRQQGQRIPVEPTKTIKFPSVSSEAERAAIGSKVKANKSYLLLSQEQFLPWGRIEAPTRKEYLTVNKREVSSRKEFLNTDTVQNIPTSRITQMLGDERPFNMVSTGNNEERMGRIISYVPVNDSSIKNLKARLGLSEVTEEIEPPKELMMEKGSFGTLSPEFNTFSKSISENDMTQKTSGRDVSWFGAVDYEYTGAKHPAQDMPDEFATIARQLEQKLGYREGYFNSVLSNLYPKGSKVARHSDDEKIFIRENKTIGAVATVNLGGKARITITNKKTGDVEDVITVEDGDLYVMPDGTFQTEKWHTVGPASGPRISMTFRHIPRSVLERQSIKTESPPPTQTVMTPQQQAFSKLEEDYRNYSKPFYTVTKAEEGSATKDTYDLISKPTVYIRVDTIPGQQHQIYVPTKKGVDLKSIEETVNEIKSNQGVNPTEFWHHPKDNNVLNEKARAWRLINIEKPDLAEALDTQTLSKAIRDSEKVRKLNFSNMKKASLKKPSGERRTFELTIPEKGTVGKMKRTDNLKDVNIWAGTNENSELSNLALRPFEYQDRQYQSVEHAYQSLKSGQFDKTTYDNPNWKKGSVKITGTKKAKTEDNWNMDLMEDLIRLSFDQNPEAQQALRNTGNARLTHNQDKGIWKNRFPAILTKLRKEYRLGAFKGGSLASVLKRKKYSNGGNLMEKIASKYYGIDRSYLRNHEKETAALVNRAVKEKIVNPREEIPVDKYGNPDTSKVGDVFNAFNHALLSWKNPDRNIELQAKELYQGTVDPTAGFPTMKAQSIDWLNNSTGFNLAKKTSNREEAEKAIIDLWNTRQNKIKNNERLKYGEDLFVNPSELINFNRNKKSGGGLLSRLQEEPSMKIEKYDSDNNLEEIKLLYGKTNIEPKSSSWDYLNVRDYLNEIKAEEKSSIFKTQREGEERWKKEYLKKPKFLLSKDRAKQGLDAMQGVLNALKRKKERKFNSR